MGYDHLASKYSKLIVWLAYLVHSSLIEIVPAYFPLTVEWKLMLSYIGG